MKFKKLYKIMACVLAVILSLSATSIVSFAASWSGNASTVVPSQSIDGYYLITSPEDLSWFANQVNADAGNATLKARLTTDIYLNDVENNDYSKLWTPIGNYSADGKMFSGIFDGKGFTIYGLRINSSSDYQGLFGYLSGAQIRNVTISSSSIAAVDNVGAIAGYANNTTAITSCVVNAQISGGSNVGGISGYLANSGNISNCSFSGSINATGNRVGGITGCVAFGGTISQSFNEATVYSTGKYVGGICGTNSGSIIISCYNTGKISGDLRVAGISGNNVGDISSCYNASKVESISEPAGLIGAIAAFYYTAKITDCYYDATLYTDKEDNATPMETDEMKRHSFVTALNGAAGNYYYDYLVRNNGYPILSWQVDQNLWDGTVSEPKKSSDGKYYYINNGRELAWFAGLVNGTLDGVAQNPTANAMLMSSVVLNVGNLAEGSNVWTPIGTETTEFSGEFIGNGFTVRGMYIPSGDVVGLFGAVSASGSITNLTITESYISGGFSVGAVAAINYGTVEGVKVIYSTVNGDTYVGGIAGENGGSILNSSSIYSDITGAQYVGGLVGENHIDAVIETCCSFNTVNGTSNVGGIAGESGGYIFYSFNAGPVTATDSYVGGIAGTLTGATVNNCYNTADITGSTKVGGIAGQLRQQAVIDMTYSIGNVTGSIDTNAILGGLTNGTISNSYYDRNKVNIRDQRATGLTTAQMTGSTAFNNMSGFSNRYWTLTADGDYFVYYPQLTSFASTGDFDLYDISFESVSYLKTGLICKVIGTQETSYFATLNEAAAKIGTGTGTIELMANVTISSTVTIDGDVTIIPSNDSIVLLRSKYLFDTPFNVNGTLSFGADDATYAVLTVNGNDVNDVTNQKFAKSMVTVNEGATFNYYDAISINNKADNGGFVYNEGTVNFYSGSISNSTAVEYGGVAYNLGDMNVYATEMTNNNSKLAGGVLFNAGGEININTGADIHNNTSGDGGAVYVNGGTVNLLGGAIYLNSASYGGAFDVAEMGKLKLYDGTVYENTATVSGSGIYTVGSVEFYSGGNIDASNDVYLPFGETVTMSAKSVFTSSILNITPEIYAEGIKVVSGDYTAMNAGLCTITPDTDTAWHINSSGHLTTSEIKYVLTASFFNSDEVPYTSFKEAMADIGENPAIITLIDDITLGETMVIKSNISIESDGIAHTISVPVGFEGPMFRVVNDAVLSLGNRTYEETSDVLYLNGTNLTGETMIDVVDGALKIYSGTVLFGCNEIDSAVKSADLVEMYGGKVTENNVKIGALHIAEGQFNFFAGTIFDNTSIGVYSNGAFNIYDGAGVDESNIVYLTDGNVINVVVPEPIYDEETGEEIVQDIVIPDFIANVDFEKYYVDTSIISSAEEDVSKYAGKFTVKDATYTLDEMNILRADTFVLLDTSTLIMTENWIYGLSINTYTARSLCLQFTNTNIAVMTKDGRIKGDDEKVGTGDCVVLLDANGNAYRSLPVLIYGDTNGDGDVNGNDALIVTLYNFGFFTSDQFSAVILEAMDVNHNGSIDDTDASIIDDMGIFIGEIDQTP